ncbi:MAG TPA: SulP family inorganic anion transporter, partial [Puia sp.]|nr:SulP family inorganic anion transporter [Puia sp.]
ILLSAGTIVLILLWPKVSSKVPGSLVAVLVTTILVAVLHLPVETVGSRFGQIRLSLPHPFVPHLDYLTIKTLIQPAFTIALLGGIESLLSAVVADGMIGGNHRSNMELVAQGVANVCSALFGGIPATGAIARTATNVKNGGRTPVAGMTHAVTLLLILLFFGQWAARIPMATLAGVLVIVSYNMSEWRSFLSILKGPGSDVAILLTTFFLTVVVDLTVAIEIGMILAAFLFMRSMIRSSSVSSLVPLDDENDNGDGGPAGTIPFPAGVEAFEIEGPLFFGAAYKFQDVIQMMDRLPRVLIIRMRKVPVIDATGIRVMKSIVKETAHRGTKIILSEPDPRVLKDLTDARLVFAVGKANITDSLEEAVERSRVIIASMGSD